MAGDEHIQGIKSPLKKGQTPRNGVPSLPSPPSSSRPRRRQRVVAQTGCRWSGRRHRRTAGLGPSERLGHWSRPGIARRLRNPGSLRKMHEIVRGHGPSDVAQTSGLDERHIDSSVSGGRRRRWGRLNRSCQAPDRDASPSDGSHRCDPACRSRHGRHAFSVNAGEARRAAAAKSSPQAPVRRIPLSGFTTALELIHACEAREGPRAPAHCPDDRRSPDWPSTQATGWAGEVGGVGKLQDVAPICDAVGLANRGRRTVVGRC